MGVVLLLQYVSHTRPLNRAGWQIWRTSSTYSHLHHNHLQQQVVVELLLLQPAQGHQQQVQQQQQGLQGQLEGSGSPVPRRSRRLMTWHRAHPLNPTSAAAAAPPQQQQQQGQVLLLPAVQQQQQGEVCLQAGSSLWPPLLLLPL